MNPVSYGMPYRVTAGPSTFIAFDGGYFQLACVGLCNTPLRRQDYVIHKWSVSGRFECCIRRFAPEGVPVATRLCEDTAVTSSGTCRKHDPYGAIGLDSDEERLRQQRDRRPLNFADDLRVYLKRPGAAWFTLRAVADAASKIDLSPPSTTPSP